MGEGSGFAGGGGGSRSQSSGAPPPVAPPPQQTSNLANEALIMETLKNLGVLDNLNKDKGASYALVLGKKLIFAKFDRNSRLLCISYKVCTRIANLLICYDVFVSQLF